MHAVILVYDPDDIPSRDSGFPNPQDDYLFCRCLPVLSQEGDAVVVEYKQKPLSVFRDRVKLVADPGYKVGDTVQTRPPRSPRAGVIEQIIWHFKDHEPKFYLSIEGKLWNSAYRQSELARSGSPEH
jgi:hypothetical protein